MRGVFVLSFLLLPKVVESAAFSVALGRLLGKQRESSEMVVDVKIAPRPRFEFSSQPPQPRENCQG